MTTVPATPATTPAVPDAAHARDLLRDMLRIRRFEERCAELYQAEKIRGFLHLYIGEEAVATGVMRALTPDDSVVATYREHGHALVRGVPARAIMAEMFGKATGCSGGRGGSMHLFDTARRFYGGNAIVGGGLPLAVGLALADRMLGRRSVTACFFGDGAVAEGTFHESLNLASLWGLPVLFCCENNLYAMGTALVRAQAQVDFTAKAAGYRVAAHAVDGMDVDQVAAASRDAVATVRAGDGPMLLEFRTYRFRAHSMFDPELYRTREEVDAWKARCPITTYEARLRAAGVIDDAAKATLEAEVGREVEDAVAFAESSPWESVDTLTRHVYSEPGPGHAT